MACTYWTHPTPPTMPGNSEVACTRTWLFRCTAFFAFSFRLFLVSRLFTSLFAGVRAAGFCFRRFRGFTLGRDEFFFRCCGVLCFGGLCSLLGFGRFLGNGCWLRRIVFCLALVTTVVLDDQPLSFGRLVLRFGVCCRSASFAFGRAFAFAARGFFGCLFGARLHPPNTHVSHISTQHTCAPAHTCIPHQHQYLDMPQRPRYPGLQWRSSKTIGRKS